MTDKDHLKTLRIPTEKDPLRILASSCLMGILCGADGSSYGSYPLIIKISEYKNVALRSFCPENYSFGTPREIPDISGGSGGDVLDGKAKVITQTGKDLTKGMITAAERMLEIALEHETELAIMMDVSAACGSQVIYKEHRLSQEASYQIGMGVCAELLSRNGIKIISQRDYRSLDILLSKIDPSHQRDTEAIDHHETEWYKEYFKK